MASKKNSNGRPASLGPDPRPGLTPDGTEWLLPFADNIDEFVWLVDLETDRVLYANPAFERIFGRPLETFCADYHSVAEIVHPDDREDFQLHMEKGAKPDRRGYRIVRPDGETRWISTRIYPLPDAQGRARRVGGVTHDVTQQMEAQSALAEQERLYRDILETASDAVFSTDLDGQFTYVNPSAERLTGYRREELSGKRFIDLVEEEWQPRVVNAYVVQVAEKTRETRHEFPIRTASGQRKWIEQTVSLLIDDGRVLGLQGIGRDITERRQAEEALRRSEAARKAILDAIPDLIFRVSREGVYLDVHAPEQMQLPLPTDQIIGHAVGDIMSPEAARPILEGLRQAFEEPGKVVVVESPAVYDAARIRERRILASGPDEALIIARDITERRQAEEALHRSEAARKAILDAMPDLIFRVNRQGVYLDVHAPDLAELPIPPDQIIGKPIGGLLPPDLAAQMMEALNRAFEQPGKVVIIESRDAFLDGVYRERRILASGPDEALIILRDITERKQAEEALRQSEAARKAILDAIPDTMIRINSQGMFLDVHVPENWQLPIPLEKMTGMRLQDFLPPEAAHVASEALDKAFRTGKTQIFNSVDPFDSSRIIQSRVVVSGPGEALVILSDVTERARAEEALLHSEAAREAMLDAIPDMMFRLTRDGIYLDVHAPDVSMLPVPPAEFIGRSIRDILPAPHAEQEMRKVDQAFSQPGTVLIFEAPDPFQPEIIQEARMLVSGPNEVLIILRNVTEQRQAEEALRRSEAARKAMLDAMPDMIFRMSRAGVYLDVHAPDRSQFPVPPEAYVGRSVREMMPEKPAQQVMYALGHVFETGQTLVTVQPDPYNAEVTREVRIVLSGPDEALLIVRDVTEQKKAEEALRQREADLAEAQKVARLGNWSLDFAANSVRWSDELYRIFDVDKAAFGGTYEAFLSRVHPDDRARILEVNTAARSSGKSFEFEYRTTTRSGELKHIREIGYAKKDNTGAVVGLFGIAQDITESKRAADAIRESEARFRKLFELSPDAIVLIDPHDPDVSWPIIDCNEVACQVNGYSRREMIGKSIDILHVREKGSPPAEREEYLERLRREGAFKGETIHRRKDGRLLPVMYSTSLITLGDRELVLGIDRDITERKQAEEALRRSEERFRLLAERAPVGIFETNTAGEQTYVNPRWSLLTGRTLDEVRGEGWLKAVHPDDRKRVLAAWQTASRKKAEFNAEYRYMRPNGEIVWAVGSATPVYDEAGAFTGHLGTVIDITHRKRAEMAEQEQRALSEALRETAAAVNSTLDLDAVLDRILEKLGSVVPHDAANITLVEGGRLRMASQRGYKKRGLAARVARIDLPLNDVPILQDAYGRSQAILITDVSHDARWVDLRGDHAVKSFVAAPIIRDEQVLGFLNLDSYVEGFFTAEHLHRLEAFAEQVSVALNNARLYRQAQQEIAERKRAEQAEKQQRAVAEALAESAAAANSTLDLDVVLNRILEKLGKVVPHEAANIMLVEGARLRMASHHGYTQRGLTEDMVRMDVPISEIPNLHQAYLTRRAVLVSDVTTDSDWVQLRGGWDIQSYIAAPIVRDEQVLGFLNLDSSTPGFFTEDHIPRLAAFADQAAIALHNAQLYRQAQQEIAERERAQKAEREHRTLAEALRDTAAAINSTLDLDALLGQILETLGSVVPHEGANVMLVEDGRLRVASFHGYGAVSLSADTLNVGAPTEATPLLREAYQTRRPVLVSDTASDPRWVAVMGRDGIRSYVVAPITRDDQVLGFLNLDSSLPGFFAEEQLKPLAAFADQAAIALSNARNYAQAQQEIAERKRAEAALWQQNDYLAGLHEVTLGLVQQQDRQTRLKTVVMRAASMLGAQDACLDVVEPGHNRLRMEVALGRYEPSLGEYTLPGEGQAGTAWRTGKSEMTMDYQSFPGKRAGREWLRTAIAMPLKIGSEVIGVLETGFDHTAELDLERIFYLERLAELAALTFQNARLYEQAQQEIADRKQVEEALAHQRDFATQVMEALGQGLLITRRDETIEYINPAFAQLAGRTPEELIDRPTIDLVAEDDRPVIVAHSLSRFDGVTDSYEVRLLRPDGSTLPVLVTGTPRRAGNVIVGSIAVVTDLTRQKQTEESLARQAAELAALYRASSRLLSAGLTPSHLATEIGQGIAHEMKATFASVWMNSQDGRSLELVGDAGSPHPDGRRSHPVDGPGLLAEAYRTGAPVYSPDVRQDPHGAAFNAGALSRLAIPLHAEGQVAGVLAIDSLEPDAFNEQSQRLFSMFGEQVGLALENIQLIDRLNSATLTAVEANRAKSAFLANMSHEIRTPLNGVLGLIELVLGTQLTQPQRDDLATAQQSAESLLSLINDILDLSKIEAGRLELEEVDFDFGEMIRQTVQIVEPRMKERGLRFNKRIGPRVPPALRGDPTRLRQVLINLLGNATKFTSEGGVSLSVSVKARQEDRVLLHFSVRDTGIGIPEDKLGEIFQPFTQVDDSTTRKYGGTGLGLTIVRRLVEKFGGAIWVESAVGKGSAFHFTAQLGLAEMPAPQAERPAPAPKAAAPLEGLRILVAEDNLVNQRVMSGMLSKRGWEVVVVSDGLQAVDQAQKSRFDAILMDVQMPRLDGFEATARIREHEGRKGQHTPIVALTAHAMQGDRERCIAAGMDDYLSKPVKMEDLYAAIDSLMAGRKVKERRVKPSKQTVAVFDREEALHYIGDDVGLLHEVLVIFQQEWQKDMAEIEMAAERGDLHLLALIAHRMKGQTGVLGGQQARAEALSVEQLARSSDLPGARKRIKRLAAALRRMDEAVSVELAQEMPKGGDGRGG